MIPTWLTGLGGKLLGILTGAVALLGFLWAKQRSDEGHGRDKQQLEDAKKAVEVQRKMAAAPRVGSDADLVERLRKGGF